MTKHIEYKLQDKKTGKLHNYTYRHNRFNGEAILLTLKEADKYDAIINNERAATEEDELKQDVGISELCNLPVFLSCSLYSMFLFIVP